ncbi:hypothetical protein CVT26_002793 [Gymnopilus dilepis]|uniref:Uncharacterized protein n=1 Tax=Gymnopilus dilepis TaxID=231916 RepID=A0A409Y3B2_9AGAR|nr:hypothetical protein CVT26_002793 [Gymnopilus dilepis]
MSRSTRRVILFVERRRSEIQESANAKSFAFALSHVSHDDHQQKFELLVRTCLIPPPDPPPSPLSCLRFPSTSAASHGWPSFAPRDARCDVAAANAASSNNADQVPTLAVATVTVKTASSFCLFYDVSTPPSRPRRDVAAATAASRALPRIVDFELRGCQRTSTTALGCHDHLAYIAFTTLRRFVASLFSRSSSPLSPLQVLAYCCITDAALVGSSTLPGAACDVAAASTVLSCLANPGLAHFELSLKHPALERLPGLSSHCDIVL